jgi:hypothetical protein
LPRSAASCNRSSRRDRCALNVDAEVAWVGYANARIRAQIEPLLQQARARGWSDSDDRATVDVDAFADLLRAPAV